MARKIVDEAGEYEISSEEGPRIPNPTTMSLQEKRVYFTRLACALITEINALDGVECAVDEWTVHNPRMVKVGTQKVLAEDRVHHPRGQHPKGLAVDLLVYINGEYIVDGDHPVWRKIENTARRHDPNFGLGLHFNDANHLSYDE
jgi:hypothetical protein